MLKVQVVDNDPVVPFFRSSVIRERFPSWVSLYHCYYGYTIMCERSYSILSYEAYEWKDVLLYINKLFISMNVVYPIEIKACGIQNDTSIFQVYHGEQFLFVFFLFGKIDEEHGNEIINTFRTEGLRDDDTIEKIQSRTMASLRKKIDEKDIHFLSEEAIVTDQQTGWIIFHHKGNYKGVIVEENGLFIQRFVENIILYRLTETEEYQLTYRGGMTVHYLFLTCVDKKTKRVVLEKSNTMYLKMGWKDEVWGHVVLKLQKLIKEA